MSWTWTRQAWTGDRAVLGKQVAEGDDPKPGEATKMTGGFVTCQKPNLS